MRAWVKRTAVAVLATAAIAGVALAAITPGSDAWERVMNIKLRAMQLKLQVAQEVAKTEDSVSRQVLLEAAKDIQACFDKCETLLK